MRPLQHHFSSDRQLPNDRQLHSATSTSMPLLQTFFPAKRPRASRDESITLRSCTMHRSYRAAIQAGMSEDDALAVRAQMFKKAGAFHDLVHRG